MPKGTREIRRKIKSVKNTRQITKAMELVAASKMRRAVANTLALRPYARLARALLSNLAQKTSEGANEEQRPIHPLLASRPAKNILVIIMSTDKGLCGGLNTQLFRALMEYIKAMNALKPAPMLSFVAMGKKAQDFLRRMDAKIVAAYPALSNHPQLKDTLALSRMILQDYATGVYDKVMLLYTDFISAINQKPMLRRLLPLSKHALEEMVAGIEARYQSADIGTEAAQYTEYLFEPSPNKVLEILLPRLTEMQIYSAVLEAAASEHSARMFAMRNASDNASEFIDDLTLMYNQLRQASITAELAEISAGRAALG